MKYVLLIVIFVFRSCQTEPAIVTPPVDGEIFTLRVGQSMTIPTEHLKVGFRKVLDDSRCPTGAVCFWEGMARPQVWLLKSGADTVFVVPAIRGYITQSDTCCHAPVDTAGYRITIVQLDPYPRLDGPVPIPASEYVAYVRVKKLLP